MPKKFIEQIFKSIKLISISCIISAFLNLDKTKNN